jgi:hypothetical protein
MANEVYCPACKAVYPAGTRECYRCKRPGDTAIRRHSALLPVEDTVAQSLDAVAADPVSFPAVTVHEDDELT